MTEITAANQLNEKGRTRYSIASDRPVGPLGVAYHRKKSVAVNSLPDFKVDPEGYKQKLNRKPYFIDPEMVAKFGRHARCFLSVPFSFSEQVECLVCIDCQHPLDSIPKKELERIGRWIQVIYELTMASLWRLRM